jgi:hypothetical protein
MRQRIYLKLGDRVKHLRYFSWGIGEVGEEKHSELPGGFCLVRILFQDGLERSFINDMDHQHCCYHAGIRLVGECSLWES